MADKVIPRLSGGFHSTEQEMHEHKEQIYTKETIRESYSRDRDMSKVTVIPAAPVPSLFGSHKKQRVAVYCRVSTDGIQQTTSFELQRKYYLKYVRKKPEWALVAMYSDEGITATSTVHRIGLLQMLDDARAGKFDIIVVKNLSRLSRNLMDCMNIVKEMRNLEHPVGILFETENMYTLGENMDFTIQILSLVAQEESHKKSEAMNASYKQRFEQGMFMKPDLLGYDRSGINELVINPDEAKTVQLIFMMYLASYHPKQIAEVLTMLGRKTHLHRFKDGRTKGGIVRWTAQSVKNVMKNERRCGDVLAQKTYTVDYLEHRSVINNNKLPQYYAREQHEAIVSPADFLIAQRMLKANCQGWQYGLPALQVYQEGPFSGYVKTVPRWIGFDSEDYNRAALKAYGVEECALEEIAGRIEQQEQRTLMHMQEELRRKVQWDDDFVLFADDETEQKADVDLPAESFYEHIKRMKTSEYITKKETNISSYDLSGLELVRPQFFSLREKVYFMIDQKSITFNKRCYTTMQQEKCDEQHVEIIYNPINNTIVVFPAQQESETTIRWCSQRKNGNVEMNKCVCRGLTQTIFGNMGWNEDFRYKIVGNPVCIGGRNGLAFYLEEPIIVVSTKSSEKSEEENSIIQKEALPENAEEISADDSHETLNASATQSRSRAIYFDDFAAKKNDVIYLADMEADKFSPEYLQRLLQKGMAPVEGWSYLKGMAQMGDSGFSIYPEEWQKDFGPCIYERVSAEIDYRQSADNRVQKTQRYGWTVGLDLPTRETVRAAISALRAEVAS